MGKSVTSFFTHPVRAIMVLIVTIALWFVGKKVEAISWVQTRSDKVRRVTSWIVAFLFACLFVMFIQMFLVKSAVVQTDDMSPTLNKGDRVIINKIKVTFNMLKDGDIIMYRHNNQLHFGRLVGKPGESIEVINGKLYRDDRQVNKFYAKIEILIILQ